MATDRAVDALIGEWVGGFDFGGGRQVIYRARFVSAQDRRNATIDVEDDVGLALTHVTFESSTVHFELRWGATTVSFRGQLSGDTIVGSVERGEAKGMFDLARVATVPSSLVEEYTGTYQIGPNHVVFIGYLLGSPQLTYYDFQTGRVGALFPESETTFFAGREFFVPFPKDVRITFERGGPIRMAGMTWQQKGERDQFGTRLLFQTIEVTFANGDATLAGSLFLPSGDGPHPGVVLIHGSGPQTRAHLRVHAEYFARRGIAALAYDKRGTGRSAGDLQGAIYQDLAEDALTGARLLQRWAGIEPTGVGLCGSSQGGWIAPLAARQAEELAFIVLVAGPAVSVAQQNVDNAAYSLRAQGLSEDEVQEAVAHVERFNQLWRTGEGWEALRQSATAGRHTRWAAYAWPGPDQPPSPEEIGSADHDRDPVMILEQVQCPILALFGGQDTVVPVESNLAPMQRALSATGTLANAIVVFPRANHLFLVGDPDGRLTHCTHFIPEYLQTIADWILRQSTAPM
jgi:pimeloyl-ACP methyl ester carboxylesterase